MPAGDRRGAAARLYAFQECLIWRQSKDYLALLVAFYVMASKG